MPDLNRMWQWAVNTCNAPNVGYSQKWRAQQVVNGITYYDCSSFDWYGLIAGEFPLSGYPFTTATMRAKLSEIGWNQVDINGEWKPCDIVWRPGHTEIVYQGGTASGICMGAHTSNAKLENQVSIGSSSGNPTYVSTSANYTELWRYGEGGASGEGVNLAVVAAICGNFWQESTINPGIWQNLTVGAPGYGLGQWTDNASTDRRTRLFNWLDSNGYSRDSGSGQMKYFVEENYWTPVSGVSYGSLQQFLSTSDTDISDLTYAFKRCWEGNNDSTLQARIAAAEKCYTYIQQNLNNPNITDWVTGNRYLSEAERLNNAVMLYRSIGQASGGGGGGDTPGIPGKQKPGDLPVWMMIRYK